jgi:excisionase family DNA binding protein
MMNNQSHQDGFLSSSSPLLEQTAIDYTSPLWTVEEVAGYLKLQPETVRSMARRGELPAIKLGKVWRFRKTAIHEMLVNMG